ncbi:MAG: rhomboid family intramembrane serine protease [Chloroflexota bacterium]
MDTSRLPSGERIDEIKGNVMLLLGFVAAMWVVELVDWAIFHGRLDSFGIIPRQMSGLIGIPLAPFLHGGSAHLIANTVPILVLGLLVILRNGDRFLLVSIIIIFISGLGTWLIGPSHSVHIGASGLIFGYVGYLVASAYYERSWGAILLAILVIALYGGIIWGVLPQGNGISWQGHFFGLIGGVLAARWTTTSIHL